MGDIIIMCLIVLIFMAGKSMISLLKKLNERKILKEISKVLENCDRDNHSNYRWTAMFNQEQQSWTLTILKEDPLSSVHVGYLKWYGRMIHFDTKFFLDWQNQQLTIFSLSKMPASMVHFLLELPAKLRSWKT